MPQNFYELIWMFMIYAFIGWCCEVGYAAVEEGEFVNRGFLNGPYCPIYGCGFIVVIFALTPLKEKLLLLFFGSFILTSAIEFITGFVLEKVFHNKWWDYSNFPFNIKGYVCLKFSIYWGLACTFIMDIVHPVIHRFIKLIPHILGIVLISVLMVMFAADLIITIATILKFNKRLKALDEVAKKIHNISDEIGVRVYENVTTAKEKTEEFQENHEELISKIEDTKENIQEFPANAKEKLQEIPASAKEKLQEIPASAKEKLNATTENARLLLDENMQKYKELMEQKNFGFKRLMKAFPDMISQNQNEMLQKYREQIFGNSDGNRRKKKFYK